VNQRLGKFRIIIAKFLNFDYFCRTGQDPIRFEHLSKVYTVVSKNNKVIKTISSTFRKKLLQNQLEIYISVILCLNC
jgi:hypothetical protein